MVADVACKRCQELDIEEPKQAELRCGTCGMHLCRSHEDDCGCDNCKECGGEGQVLNPEGYWDICPVCEGRGGL
jgi:hypothetical protein